MYNRPGGYIYLGGGEIKDHIVRQVGGSINIIYHIYSNTNSVKLLNV